MNGHELDVPCGISVLEAAGQNGIHIPTLCRHEALAADASCRLCICEMSIVKRGKTSQWMAPACIYPVEENLKVLTDSPKTRRQRKFIIELLLARAPQSTELLILANEYGCDPARFQSPDRVVDNCILCGLCVKACAAAWGDPVIGFAGRGVHKTVTAPLGNGDQLCRGCLACVHVCPTGAIETKLTAEGIELPKWETEIPMVECLECGKPFAPVPLLNEVEQKLEINQEILNRCPGCRRQLLLEPIGIRFREKE
jgi:NADH dehydrogenase/NADH:ubiquinone oxidoreductase subunit G